MSNRHEEIMETEWNERQRELAELRVRQAELERDYGLIRENWNDEVNAHAVIRAKLVAELSFHEKTKLRLQAIEEQLGESRKYGAATRAELAKARELVAEARQGFMILRELASSGDYSSSWLMCYCTDALVALSSPAVPPDSARPMMLAKDIKPIPAFYGLADAVIAANTVEPDMRQEAVERVIAAAREVAGTDDLPRALRRCLVPRDLIQRLADALTALDGAGETPVCSPADRIIAHTLTRDDLPATVREAAEPETQ